MALRLATLSAHAHLRQLWSAIDSHDIDKMEEILAVHSIANCVNPDGVTPLLQAVRHNSVSLVRTLIAHGADVNAARPDGFTPLLLATFFGYSDIVAALVQQGANVSATTRFGTTAKMWAMARGFYNIAEYLQQWQDNRGKLGLVAGPSTDNEGVHRHEGSDPAFAKPELDTESKGFADPNDIPAPTALATDPTLSVKGEVTEYSTPPLAVRKLKDPSEIWDLVHEKPSNFKPGLALVSRITSKKQGAMVLTLAVMLILVTGALAALSLRTKRNASTLTEFAAPSSAPLASASDDTSVKQTDINKEKTQHEPAQSFLTPNAVPEVKVDAAKVVDNKLSSTYSKSIGSRSLTRSSLSSTRESSDIGRQAAAGVTKLDPTAGDSVVKSPTEQPLKVAEVKSNDNKRVTAASPPPRKPSNVDPNSQLLGRPFGTSTSKPKVIQWP